MHMACISLLLSCVFLCSVGYNYLPLLVTVFNEKEIFLSIERVTLKLDGEMKRSSFVRLLYSLYNISLAVVSLS